MFSEGYMAPKRGSGDGEGTVKVGLRYEWGALREAAIFVSWKGAGSDNQQLAGVGALPQDCTGGVRW